MNKFDRLLNIFEIHKAFYFALSIHKLSLQTNKHDMITSKIEYTVTFILTVGDENNYSVNMLEDYTVLLLIFIMHTVKITRFMIA